MLNECVKFISLTLRMIWWSNLLSVVDVTEAEKAAATRRVWQSSQEVQGVQVLTVAESGQRC